MEIEILKDRIQNSYLGDKNIATIIKKFIYCKVIECVNRSIYKIREEYGLRCNKKHGEYIRICIYHSEYIEKEEQYTCIYIVDEKLREKTIYKHRDLDLEYKDLWIDGHVTECFYKDGKREGEAKIWYRNGQIHVICYFKDGKKDGEYREWYEDGQIHVISYYKDDKLEGEYKVWSLNGNGYYEYFYKDGKREGEAKSWNHEKLYKISYYKNDELEGECKIYYENGQIEIQSSYKNDKLEGEYKKWDKEGVLISYCIYENGVEVERII